MSKTMAIFIEAHGEITTPNFPDLSDADHPGGQLRYISDLIDSVDTIAIAVPNSRLVVRLDGHAYTRMRDANIVATFEDAFDLPILAVCGPLKRHRVVAPAWISRHGGRITISDRLTNSTPATNRAVAS